jgi:hypothetical protein
MTGVLPVDFGILATGALGFTIALAWNDAVSIAVRGTDIFGAPSHGGAGAAALHAAVVTVLVIAVAVALNTVARIAHYRVASSRDADGADPASRGQALNNTSSDSINAIAFRPHGPGSGQRPRSVVRLWSPDTEM